MPNPKTQKVNWEQASRWDWSTEPKNDEGYPGHMEIIVGTMQRMANMMETLIESDRQDSKTREVKLAATLDYYVRNNPHKTTSEWYEAIMERDALKQELKEMKTSARAARLDLRRISALNGVITKLKKKIEKLEDAKDTLI